MRKSMVLATVAMMCLAGVAQAAVLENFDSYTSQAEFEAVWTPQTPGTSMLLLQGYDHTTGQTNSVQGIAAQNYTTRNEQHLASELVPTDAQPIMFEFWMQLADPAETGARNFNEVRSYDDAGNLTALIAMGVYNGTADSSKWSVRTLFGGSNWQATTADRTADWTKLTALIKASSVEYYVNDALAFTDTYSGGPIDRIVLGSGLTSAGMDALTDDLFVGYVPEPATLVMLVMGGLVALRRRSV